jgi:hypothetical protein
MRDLVGMQPGIDRDRAETGGPAGEQHLQKFGAVFHAQHDAVAGFEASPGEPARQARDPASELAVAPCVDAVADRRRLRLPAGDVE